MRPKIPSLTIVCVSGVQPFRALRAIFLSAIRLNVGQVLFVNMSIPEFRFGKFQSVRPVKSRLDSIDAYGRYVQFHLWVHLKTQHALIVQADGWVLNSRIWRDDFLKYDYIGAPWPISHTAYLDPFGVHQRVGNGGFSLRSRRLLQMGSQLDLIWDVITFGNFNHFNAKPLTEDGNICIHNRHLYETAGCRFAPLEVAMDFSRELPIPESRNPKTLGFHKYHPRKSRVRKIIGKSKALLRRGNI
jgi:hypothetical protein